MILHSIELIKMEEFKMKESCCGEYKCLHGALPFFGRLLISLIFILAGIGKIFDFQGAVDTLRSIGVGGAMILIFIALLMELIGGILLLLGWFTRVAIWLLWIFLLPTTLLFHGFWNFTGPEMALQLSIFLKNLTIYGGLMAFYSYGPGRWSLDACRTCRRKESK